MFRKSKRVWGYQTGMEFLFGVVFFRSQALALPMFASHYPERFGQIVYLGGFSYFFLFGFLRGGGDSPNLP